MLTEPVRHVAIENLKKRVILLSRVDPEDDPVGGYPIRGIYLLFEETCGPSIIEKKEVFGL